MARKADRNDPGTWTPFRINYPTPSGSIAHIVRQAADIDHALERVLDEFGNQEFTITSVE